MKPVVALITAREARGLDEDLPPLEAAMHAAGLETRVVDWDDPDVRWASFDLALLRSTWDYTDRLREFLAWADSAGSVTTLLNTPQVVRWNTDKHYLAELARAECRWCRVLSSSRVRMPNARSPHFSSVTARRSLS